MKKNDIVNILWSGGRDSTFRILHLLLINEKKVQPYYVIDSDRLSTGLEIRTIRNIKRRLFAEYPKTSALLLPTYIRELDDIKPNQEITDCFQTISKNKHIGIQFEWYARFADEYGIDDLELCIDGGPGDLSNLLGPNLPELGSEDERSYELKKEMQGTPEYAVFRYFEFPLFYLTKLDMEQQSKKEGFYDLMELTWFCHRPRANGTPCGTCVPCIYTIKEGLGRRIPLIGRMKYRILFIRKIKVFLERYPRLCNFLRKVKRLFRQKALYY